MQIIQTGRKNRKRNDDKFKEEKIEKEDSKTLIKTIKVLKTDSYEIDWATERSLPIKEYLELEDQPASKTEKTITDPIQKNIIRDRFIFKNENKLGIVNQINKDKKSAKCGAKLYVNLFERSGIKFCLDNNLKASNKGWRTPTKETLLGPKRLWNNPITFRSNRVKKAIDKTISKQWINQDKSITKEY